MHPLPGRQQGHKYLHRKNMLNYYGHRWASKGTKLIYSWKATVRTKTYQIKITKVYWSTFCIFFAAVVPINSSWCFLRLCFIIFIFFSKRWIVDIRVDHVMAASIKMDSRTRKWLVSRVTDITSFVERERDNAKPMANGLAINPRVLQVSTVYQCQDRKSVV